MASGRDVPQAKTNLEIKARCRDLAAARAAATRLATRYLGVDAQTDTYFVTRAGRLKLRRSSVSGGQLIPYLRPDRPGPKRADYQVIPVPDAAHLERTLATILGVHRVVRKRREIFLVDNVRIHLDEVEGLGCFLELEAVYDGSESAEAEQHAVVARLMRELGVAEDDLVATSYEGLLDPARAGSARAPDPAAPIS
jgi:predicted adenylyl cyclase CyaB